MGLSQKVKAYREGRGWSQSDLARATGIPQPTIWRLENGDIKHPKADTLVALANTFKVPIDYLVQDDYELHPADLVRTDNDMRSLLEAYVALSEQDRHAVRRFTQSLKRPASTVEIRRYVSIAVRPRRLRKE